MNTEEKIMSIGNLNFIYVQLCIRRNRYQRMLKLEMPEHLLDKEQVLINESEEKLSDVLGELKRLADGLGEEYRQVVGGIVDEEFAKFFGSSDNE